MLGALISDWKGRISVGGAQDPQLLTAAQFNREVARERLRATRRSFPFCIITIDVKPGQSVRRQMRILVRLLNRNLRTTDQKAIIGSASCGVLLVDTPEMGGRSVIDRLCTLAAARGLILTMNLRVHDPDGFDSDGGGPDNRIDRIDPNHDNSSRRREDGREKKWLAVSGDVQVSSEDAMVSQPKYRMAIKRTIDIVGSSVGLVLTSPLLVLAVIAIRREDGQPAIFKQTREGRSGKPFTILKLRTMVVDAEKTQAALRSQSHRDGPAFKISHDPRVTKVGQLLRKTCVDELPQLINVLKGDMSLVGPRPLPWHESRACNHWHRRRLDVRPGMTCYWQVDKASVDSFDDWMRLDLKYLDRFNVYEDLKLIAKTVAVPVLGRGSE